MSLLSMLFTPTYLREPPAFFHPRILVGPGAFLTPAFVEKYGITHVLNCSFDEFSPPWWRTRFPTKYKVLNAIDSLQTNILEWYPEFEVTLQRFLREGTGMVFVHCQAGMNRSASLALVYTCKNLGMDLDTLVSSVRRQRPCILQNQVFMKQVREFVNGRIQDSENAGQPHYIYRDRYSRFFTPGNRANAQGLQNQTGESQGGTRQFTNGNISPVFYE